MFARYPRKKTLFARLFNRFRPQTTTPDTIDKLNEILEMYEKKEAVLSKKAAAQVQKAHEFLRVKNKRAATLCLKKKRLYERQVELLGNIQLHIHDQMIAKATTEAVAALRTGAAAMQAMKQATNINDVDRIMDEIKDHRRQIQDALSIPIGSAANFDEDKLEAEFKELEEQRLQPAMTAPAVPSGRVAAPRKNTPEEDELAVLQAEMVF